MSREDSSNLARGAGEVNRPMLSSGDRRGPPRDPRMSVEGVALPLPWREYCSMMDLPGKEMGVADGRE